MEGIVTNCGQNIADRLLNLTINQARYLCCYKCIVEDFENEKKELEPKLKKVEHDVEGAKNRNEVILEDVEYWLQQGNNLVEEDSKNKETWFFRWCPNCIWQYRRGKDLAEKMVKIKDLKAINFDKVGRSRELLGVIPQDFIQFKSRDSAYQELLEALKDTKNYMVGLHGMGGSGKTTLVKQVGENVEKSKLFDKVVFVVISNNPDIKKIQNNIAKPLGLELKQENESEIRAKELLLRLMNGQNILLILDDVWQELKFEDIGIPSESNHNGCRVLLTSRQLNTLKNCQETIRLELLSKEETRFLFDKHAGLREDSSKDIKKLAPQIADECKRLPVAIVAIAISLRKKPLEIWKEAIKSLKELKRIHNVDDEQKIYKSLQLSYKNLNDEKAKKLFLLCSLFPEDYEIPQEYLTRFVIGLALFEDVESYETARSDVIFAKRKLLDACLLMEGEEEGCVKMHDLLRDTAHWMAQHEIQVIMGQKINANVKQGKMKYLYCTNSGFLKELDCTKLEILILLGKEVPTEEFFKGINDLRILTLDSEEYLRKGWPSLALPVSNESSKNLRDICLTGFVLGDISILRHLQAVLVNLQLDCCSFNELPNGIVGFKKLKLLRLIDCQIGRNPYEVIGGLSQIEELYFMDNEGWEGKLHNGMVASLFDKTQLKRYHIEFAEGMDLAWSVDDSISRAISIENFDASISNATMKDLVQKAEILHLNEMQGECRTIIPDFFTAMGGALSDELVEFKLRSCSQIECFINTTNSPSSVSSNLVKLEITCMDNLKEICHSSPPPDFFEKLEEVTVRECKQLHGILFAGNWDLKRLKVLICEDCPVLTSLFTAFTARSLKQLEELLVNGCKKFKYIIEFEGEEEKREKMALNDDDPKRYGSMFPNLKTMQIEDFDQELEFISTASSKSRKDVLINSQQKTLDPAASLGLQRTESRSLHPFDTVQCLLTQPLILRNLRSMDIRKCPKLISFFTVSVAQTMLLEELTIFDCEGLKCVIADKVDDHDGNNCGCVFPKLRKLELSGCSQLKYFLGQYDLEAQNHNIQAQIDLPALEEVELSGSLKDFRLMNCPQFSIKSITDFMVGLNARQADCTSKEDVTVIKKHLTNCESWRVGGNSQIEGIFCLEGVRMIQQEAMSSGLKSLKLHDLPEMRYMCLGPKHILHFQNLERLSIEGCNKLEVMFSASVLKNLPQLTWLRIKDCQQLKQILEDDENENAFEASFPRLKVLIVRDCNKLEALFSISSSDQFPELRVLIVSKASRLQKVFERDGRVKVEFLKLKYLMLLQLSNLSDVCHGIDFQKVTYRFMHNCPKLSLDSTTTDIFDFQQKYDVDGYEAYDDIFELAREELYNPVLENRMQEITSLQGEDEGPEITSSQIDKAVEVEFAGEVPPSEAEAKTTSSIAIPLQNPSPQNQVGVNQSKTCIDKDTDQTKATAGIQKFAPSKDPKEPDSVQFPEASTNNQETSFEKQGNPKASCEARRVAFPPTSQDSDQPISSVKVAWSDKIVPQDQTPVGVDKGPSSKEVDGTATARVKVDVVRETSLNKKNEEEISRELANVIAAENRMQETNSLQHKDQSSEILGTAKSEATSLQVKKAVETDVAGEVPSSKTQAKATSSVAIPLQNRSPQETAHEDPITSLGQHDGEGSAVLLALESEPLFPQKKPVGEIHRSDVQAMTTTSLVTPFQTTFPKMIDSAAEDSTSEKAKELGTIKSRNEQIMRNEDALVGTRASIHSNESQKSHQAKSDIVAMTTTSIELEPVGSSPLVGSVTSPCKTSTQISSMSNKLLESKLSNNTEVDNLALSIETSNSGLSLHPDVIQELQTKLAEYLNMSLESICRDANAMDDIERIVNCLSRVTTDAIQENNLKDLTSRLQVFKKCVPKAMSTMQSSWQFISSYENQIMELKIKLNEGQAQIRDLESKLSESFAEEYTNVEMDNQQSTTGKIEILAQLTKAVSKDYENWKALEEELNLSTSRWLKSKQVLAHANASWRILKENLRL